MSTFKNLSLPAVPPALKSAAPYLKRADELKVKEPIMAYWCAYYAAQLGVTLNVKESASREFLFNLLGLLESMKKAIGPNDAIDMEEASAAYVENFAVRVFTAVDNEDRKGLATRATAAKFLAASNFLEVLKTFPKNEVTENHDDKIRYAKWKAADIAKAFREGRQPTAGPAGDALNPEDEQQERTPKLPSASLDAEGAGVPTLPPHTVRSSPPHHLPPAPDDWHQTPTTPTSWSTTATPGESIAGSTRPIESDTSADSPVLIHQDSLASTESIYDGDLGEAPSWPPSVGVIGQGVPAPSAPPITTEVKDDDTDFGLSPILVSTVQKHCRYAISALDYEDQETAKKELRAALAILEG